MHNELFETVLNLVSDAGASGDLIIDSAQSLSLKANKGELEEHKVTSSRILGLRVIKDGRVGMAYSEATDGEALHQLVKQALTNAALTDADPLETLLETDAQLEADERILCPADTNTIMDKINFALALEQELAAKDKVQAVPYNGVADGINERQLGSTSGLRAKLRSRNSYAYAYALAADGDKNAMSGKGMLARDFAQLETGPIITQVHEDCLALLDGKPVKTAHWDVIFDPDQQAGLFGVFNMALSGKSARDGINPWRDQVGQAVADARLQLWNRPSLTEGSGYSLFDAEGVASRDTCIIGNGELKTLLHNSVTARHFNIETTASANRSPKSALGVAADQLVIEAGTDSAADLTSGDYLYITDLTGLHSGANPISGAFSFGASGFWMRNGERVQAVRGITIAGNFYQMLKEITAIGSEQHWDWQKNALMASIRFASLAVSGE